MLLEVKYAQTECCRGNLWNREGRYWYVWEFLEHVESI